MFGICLGCDFWDMIVGYSGSISEIVPSAKQSKIQCPSLITCQWVKPTLFIIYLGTPGYPKAIGTQILWGNGKNM